MPTLLNDWTIKHLPVSEFTSTVVIDTAFVHLRSWKMSLLHIYIYMFFKRENYKLIRNPYNVQKT